MQRCRADGRAVTAAWARLVAPLVVAVAAAGVAGCTSARGTAAPTSPRRWHAAVELAAVQPLPQGCSVTNTCTPASAADVALRVVPNGYGDGAGLAQQPEDGGVLLSRHWVSPVPAFLDPGGEPTGPQVSVKVIQHPVESDSDALGLADNPRTPSPVQIATRTAYESDWTVPAQALDGSAIQLSATSLYVVISSTVTLEVTTIGLTPPLTQMLTRAVVVQ
jgi:hypothetical protein